METKPRKPYETLRQSLSSSFMKALFNHFEVDGVMAIAELARTRPDKYCELIASLIPQEAHVNASPYDSPKAERLSANLEWIRESVERARARPVIEASVSDRPLLPDPVRDEESRH